MDDDYDNMIQIQMKYKDTLKNTVSHVFDSQQGILSFFCFQTLSVFSDLILSFSSFFFFLKHIPATRDNWQKSTRGNYLFQGKLINFYFLGDKFGLFVSDIFIQE